MSAADMWADLDDAGLAPRPRLPNSAIDDIARTVGARFGVPPLAIFGTRGDAVVLMARRVAMQTARDRYGYSTAELGRFFGRTQSAVCKALCRIETRETGD